MWYPTEITDLVDIVWYIVKIITITTLAPSIYEVIEMVVLFLVGKMLRIVRIRVYSTYNLRKFLYQIFFLGGITKRLLLINVASALGYKITSRTSIKYIVSGSTDLRTDGDFQDSFILGYSSYIFVLLPLFLGMWSENLISLWMNLGMTRILAVLFTWWIIISLFLTGRPRGQEVIFPLVTVIQRNPNLMIMLLSIGLTSLALYPTMGLYYVMILATVQLTILLLFEVRRNEPMNEKDIEDSSSYQPILSNIGYLE